MKTYIALFRGINVGGKNVLPMKELVAVLEGLGCQNVKTYIQSGNAVFKSKEKNVSRLSNQIGVEIRNLRGFQPFTMVLTLDEIERAISKNPFPRAESAPRTLHVSFLASAPANLNLKMLDSLTSASEQFQLIDRVFYLHAPKGVGRSKLAANAERVLGIPITDRNWRTLCEIAKIAKGLNK